MVSTQRWRRAHSCLTGPLAATSIYEASPEIIRRVAPAAIDVRKQSLPARSFLRNWTGTDSGASSSRAGQPSRRTRAPMALKVSHFATEMGLISNRTRAQPVFRCDSPLSAGNYKQIPSVDAWSHCSQAGAVGRCVALRRRSTDGLQSLPSRRLRSRLRDVRCSRIGQ